MKLPSRMLPELLFQALLLKVVASTTHSVFGGKYRLRDLSSTTKMNQKFLFNLFSQSKRPLELSHIFKSVMFGNDGKGISFKNRLKRACVGC
jgi:hypothetical protein